MRQNCRTGVILRLSALLAAALTFSSCVTMAVESDFNEDGSGTHSLAISLDSSALNQLGDLGEGDPFEDFDQVEQEAEAQGYRVERIDTGDEIGVRLIRDVEDSSNLGDVLNDLFNTSSTDGAEEVFPFSGSFEQDGDDYRLDLTVNGDVLTEGAGEGLGGETEDELGGLGLESIFEFTYTARMPGEINEDETNGRVSDDGTITWDLPLSGSETLTAVSEGDGGDSNLLLILVVIGIIVLGLIALAAVAFFIFMSRRGATPAPAATTGTEAPPPPSQPSPAPPVDPDQPTRQMTPPPPGDPEPDEEDSKDNPPSY